MQYRKVEEGVFEEISAAGFTNIIHMAQIVAHQNNLTNRINEEAPSEEELLAWAHQNHPYYKNRSTLQDELDSVTEVIQLLENL